METHLEDGLYFGLDDSVYHSLPYLSASKLKTILVSPFNYWASSEMNPLRKPAPPRKRVVTNSDFMEIGRAYHKRILEGADAFYDSYCTDFDVSAYPDALKTSTEIQEALRNRGLPVSGNKDELTRRLKMSDPTAIFFDEIYMEWQANEVDKKIIIEAEIIQKIEFATAMIEKNPHLSKCFQGGYPEVTVIWTDDDGIRYKSRFDYLKPKAIIDYKGFDNSKNRKIESAIYMAMATYKYHIQAAFYMGRAAYKAVEFAKKGQVFGFATRDFLTKLAATDTHDFYFVFQQKGFAPVAEGWKFGRSSMYGCGETAVDDAIKIYKQCLAKYGSDPWVDPKPIQEFDDANFPIFATEL